jgi:general secretion pathway protein G
VSKGDLFFYVLIGLIFEPLCLSVMSVKCLLRVTPQTRQFLARANISVFRQALDLYKSDVGRFPKSGEGLQALRTNPGIARWAGPYLRFDPPPDPWGRPYLYRIDAVGEPEILSLGKNGKPGGEGEDHDVSSLRMQEPLLAPVTEKDYESARIAAKLIAPLCGVGYLFLPWIIRRYKRRQQSAAGGPRLGKTHS